MSVVLNSRPHASCGSCGAEWLQEGSWQRAVRTGQKRLPMLAGNGDGPAPHVTLADIEQDVILLPDPASRSTRRALPGPSAEEAIAT